MNSEAISSLSRLGSQVRGATLNVFYFLCVEEPGIKPASFSSQSRQPTTEYLIVKITTLFCSELHCLRVCVLQTTACAQKLRLGAEECLDETGNT